MSKNRKLVLNPQSSNFSTWDLMPSKHGFGKATLTQVLDKEVLTYLYIVFELLTKIGLSSCSQGCRRAGSIRGWTSSTIVRSDGI